MKRATLILTILLISVSCLAQEATTVPLEQATQDSLKLCSPFSSFAEAENALRSAQIVDSKELGTGVTNPIKLYLKTDTKEFKAVFKSINDKRFGITSMQKGAEVDFKDSWMYEIVAYELDKLLGLNMVPPTVERSFNQKKGSVQLWVENAMTEKERKSKHMEPPNVESWNNQLYQVRLFDNLIYNIDRNIGNLLIDNDWKVYMIDHSRSFKSIKILQNADKLSKFSKTTMEALDKLSEEKIKLCCSNYLSGPEIRTLLVRRDMLLQRYHELLATKGDSIYLP
ncbi:MAG TPA: hypothetical protein VLH08_14615 [Acidobacteriota bacterium]|jgi:hypothetical protein|nr:hypothetical protein [Acidobacteriota bacterium]